MNPTTFFSEARSLFFLLLFTCTWTALAQDVPSYGKYINIFVNPDNFLAGDFNTTTTLAQKTIQDWATQLAAQGPWSVMNKSVVPPSGDKHDYMSWAPYSWPNCTAVGNTTQLTPEEVWTKCTYYTRDGVFNPDARTLVNDIGAFDLLGDAVLYNSLAWVLSNYTSSYATNAVNFVNTWFLAPETRMNPNLMYSQMSRGPDGQIGEHTGVLDLKSMSAIVSGLLVLRKANSTAWTPALDTAMQDWTNSYISWLETSPTALGEKDATNNHGSFYFSQLASLKIFVGDMAGAQDVIRSYFSGIFMSQISANGEQPLEATRTRPYHYRSYNLAAMIANAQMGAYVGYDGWNHTTTSGSTIKTALDFALTVPPGDDLALELYPNVAAVGAAYGDPKGQYAAFLKEKDFDYPAQPYFLWNQPFSDSGLVLSGSSSPSKGGARRSVRNAGSLAPCIIAAMVYWVGI